MHSHTSINLSARPTSFSFLKWIKTGAIFLLASTAQTMAKSAAASIFYKLDDAHSLTTPTDFFLPSETTPTADFSAQQWSIPERQLLSGYESDVCAVDNFIPDKTLKMDEPFSISLEPGYYSMVGAADIYRSQLPAWLKLEATLDTLFPAYDIQKIAVQGQFVFLVAGRAGLQILNMTDIEHPDVIGSYPVKSGESYDVALSGNTALLAAGTSGLQVVDIHDIAHPFLLTTVPPLNNSAVIAVMTAHHTAFVVNRHGLQIVDIHRPNHPKVKHTLSEPEGWGIDTLLLSPDHRKIILGGQQGLQIASVDDVMNEAQWLKQPDTGPIHKLLLIDNTVMALTATGLQIVDFTSNMTNVALRRYPYNDLFPNITSFAGAKLPGQSMLVVSYGYHGLQFLDVGNTRDPKRLGHVHPLFSPEQEEGEITDIVPFQDTLLAATARKGLQRLHFKDPILRAVPSTDEPDISAGQTTSITLYQQRDTEACRKSTFQLRLDNRWSLSNAMLKDQSIFVDKQESFKLLLSSQKTFNNPNDDFLRLSLAWINRPELPPWLALEWRPIPSKKPTVGWTTQLAGANGILCSANSDGGIEILDVTTAGMPVTLAIWQGTTTDKVDAQDVALSDDGHTLFIADRQTGLRLLDISDPSAPRPLGVFQKNGVGYRQVYVQQRNVIAITDSVPQVMDVIDVVTNPMAPSLKSSCLFAARMVVNDVAVLDQQLLLASSQGLRTVDATDYTQLITPAGAEKNPIAMSAIATADDELFFTDESGQLYYSSRKDDLRDVAPVLVRGESQITETEEGQGVTDHTTLQWLQDRRLLFVASQRRGLEVFDTTYPGYPRLLGTYPATNNPFLDIVVMGKTAFVANGDIRPFSLDAWTVTAAPRVTEHQGNYHLRLTATDAFDGTAEDSFTLRVEGKPRLMEPIPSQYARVGHQFRYPIPDVTFYDPNFDVLNFTAEYDEDIDWLKFNPRLGEFYSEYLVLGPSIKNASIIVTAIDPLGLSEHTTFSLKVMYPMSVTSPIASQPLVWVQGRYANFSMTIRQHFYVYEREVTYNVTGNKHELLPAWLNFTVAGDDVGKSLTLGGVPPVIEGAKLQALSLSIRACDAEVNEEIATDLAIITQPNFPPQIRQPVAAQYVEVDQPLRLVLTATDIFFDANNDTLIYSASQAKGEHWPAWLQFHQQFNTLIVNGTPDWRDTALLSRGVFTVYLNASDPDNLTVSLPIDIHVTCRSTLLAYFYQYIMPATMLLKLFGSLIDRCNYASTKQPARTLQPGNPLSFETVYQGAVTSVTVKSPIPRPAGKLDSFYTFNRPKAALLATRFKLPDCMQPYVRRLAQQLPDTSYVLLPYKDIAYGQDWVKSRYEFGKNVVQFNAYVPPGIKKYPQLLLVIKGPWIWLQLPPAWRSVPGLGWLVEKINATSKKVGIDVIKEHCFLPVASYEPSGHALTDHFDDDIEQAAQQDDAPLLPQARHRQRYQALELTDYSGAAAKEEKTAAEVEIEDRGTGRTGNRCFAIVRACWARQRFFQPATLPEPQERHIEMQTRRASIVVI